MKTLTLDISESVALRRRIERGRLLSPLAGLGLGVWLAAMLLIALAPTIFPRTGGHWLPEILILLLVIVLVVAAASALGLSHALATLNIRAITVLGLVHLS